MFELNKIYCIDVLEGLKKIDDNSIDLIITSPPYNKIGLNGIQKGKKWNKTIDYDGDPQNDNMNEYEYEKWQLDILNELFRVLKEDGSLFYNHKNRIHKGEIISPYQWLLKSPFKIRQEIIWDRGSSQNVNRCRYMPSSELIFWLTKCNMVRFDRKRDTMFKNEIWKFIPEKGTEHPAPFPISSYQLATNIEVTQNTAWYMLLKVRLLYHQSDADAFDGIVECDEMYIGCKEKWKHKSMRTPNT